MITIVAMLILVILLGIQIYLLFVTKNTKDLRNMALILGIYSLILAIPYGYIWLISSAIWFLNFYINNKRLEQEIK